MAADELSITGASAPIGVASSCSVGAPRQAIDEQQVLEPEHALDIRPAVDARALRGLGDAEIGKLRLPTAQDVRLYLREVADFDGLNSARSGILPLRARQPSEPSAAAV
jgi:hypothetical protein